MRSVRWQRSSAVRAARKRGWASRPRRPRGLSRAASSARATVSSARFTSSATPRACAIHWSAACRDHGSTIPAPNSAAKRPIRSASSPIAAPAGCRYSGGATSMLTATPTSAPRIASSTRASPPVHHVRRGQVGGDHRIPVGLGEIHERGAALDARVVHQDVDIAVPARHVRHPGGDRVAIGDVEHDVIGGKPFAGQRAAPPSQARPAFVRSVSPWRRPARGRVRSRIRGRDRRR